MNLSAPEWLTAPSGACPCTPTLSRRADAIEKTLAGSVGVARHTVFSQETATRSGALQRVGARVKLVALAALVIATGFARSFTTLGALYAIALLLALTSRIPLRVFVLRVWLAVPLFSGLVLLPAAFAIGLHGVALIVLRVATSVSFVTLLTLTTKWPVLLQGLEALRVPRAFVMVTAMAYRYIFHLLGVIDDMFVARQARVGRERAPKETRGFVAASAGSLFGKAHALSDEVHDALVARGYGGHDATR